jgi:predicted N-acyltransferase
LSFDIKISFINSIEAINKQDWYNLNSATCPFLNYDFFNTLEKSQSATAKQGWQAHHLVAKSEDEILAIMPMYIKSHSWGEYVFDWSWADAYQQYNLEYYPKLVATIPFTPVTSDKLLSSHLALSDFFSPLIQHCEQKDINSWHILYCDEIKVPLPEDVYHRHTVQFHWFNRNYQNIDDFFNTFTSRKRRSTRKERLSIVEQGIAIRHLTGQEISEKDIEFFYLTYQLTYLKRGHQPHLTLDFFKNIISSMRENILLLVASHQDKDVACALFFYDDSQLYGRYWGCTEYYNNLHFELCYYQGIEFCIENNLSRFNPGTQGEHKIQRGFEPILTHSYHWIKHPSFKAAIQHFCQEEKAHMLTYQAQCRTLLPFKNVDET